MRCLGRYDGWAPKSCPFNTQIHNPTFYLLSFLPPTCFDLSFESSAAFYFIPYSRFKNLCSLGSAPTNQKFEIPNQQSKDSPFSHFCLPSSVFCLGRHPDIVSDSRFNHIARRRRINSSERGAGSVIGAIRNTVFKLDMTVSGQHYHYIIF